MAGGETHTARRRIIRFTKVDVLRCGRYLSQDEDTSVPSFNCRWRLTSKTLVHIMCSSLSAHQSFTRGPALAFEVCVLVKGGRSLGRSMTQPPPTSLTVHHSVSAQGCDGNYIILIKSSARLPYVAISQVWVADNSRGASSLKVTAREALQSRSTATPRHQREFHYGTPKFPFNKCRSPALPARAAQVPRTRSTSAWRRCCLSHRP